jgi:hypothetical protein
VTGINGFLRWLKSVWLSAWPLCALILLMSLVAVRFLPAGYVRAAVAGPILLMVPGSLTLGALFGEGRRPQGALFAGFAALLGAIWSAFASLALYVVHVLITADSTYWCLLIVSAPLAIVAEGRLLLGRQGQGRRVSRKPGPTDPDLSDAEAEDAAMPAVVRGASYYSAVAVVAGVSLLAGGLYAYDHLPHPSPVGYTWLAWTGPQIKGDVLAGAHGTELHFQIVHHQSGTTAFRLSALWQGTRSQPLASPVTVSIGPNRTFQGALDVPPLPDGCTYRIVVALTAARQVDPLTKKPPTWSINADIRDPRKSARTCKR